MLLIKPYLGCNLACKYCYEGRYRKKHQPKMKYNLEAIFRRMEEFKDLDIAFHGGEPLSLPKKDVEAILAKMHKLKGRSSIQTNATLVDDEFIRMFKKYKTSVGISWDGPGELSAYRPGTIKVGSTIERLVKEGISTSMIMVVSKANAGTKQRLNKLKDYLLHLGQLKISGRINPCYNTPGYELGMEKLKEVYLDLADFCLHNNLRWSPFIDIINGLKSKDRVCTFMGCDVFSTQSATVILGDGSVTNCMRTNQEDILLRHPAQYKTRNEILESIPQEHGGCKDCKYWLACYGGCPSGVIDNDWRNRTYLCPLWKSLFEFHEKILSYCDIPVISQKSEQSCVCDKDSGHGDGHGDSPHGDHSDRGSAETKSKPKHGDLAHGDAPHGDHSDRGSAETKSKPKHGDLAHGDAPYKDLAHGDSSHGDGPHGDHSDRGSAETKSKPKHGDLAHGDAPYKDLAHGDSPHGDHSDRGLAEIKSKPQHGDLAHGDAPHGDSTHGDSG